MAEPLKTSIGIWSFGPLHSRFVPDGYHPESGDERPVERARRVASGLHDLYDGMELRYPEDIDEDNASDIAAAIKPMDVYTIVSGGHGTSPHSRGALTNPDRTTRDEAKAANRRLIELASELSARVTLWLACDAYAYPFQVDYVSQWGMLLDGIADALDRANDLGVSIFLAHTGGDPGMRSYLRGTGMGLYVVSKLAAMGLDVSRLKLAIDWQDVAAMGENLAERLELLSMEGLLGHQHANGGGSAGDPDNIVGIGGFLETLEAARSLRKVGYGDNGERLGFDICPRTEDPILAARHTLLQWTFIDDLCSRLEEDLLEEAQARKDALGAMRLVFQALGMDANALRLISGVPVKA